MEKDCENDVALTPNPHPAFFLGLAILFGALSWWMVFYGPITDELHISLSGVFSRMYSESGMCGMAINMAQLVGKMPYSYFTFWLGIIVTLVGFFLSRKRSNSN